MDRLRAVMTLLKRSVPTVAGDLCTSGERHRSPGKPMIPDNNLLNPFVVMGWFALLIFVFSTTVSTSALAKPDTWVAQEGQQIRNGINAGTVALSPGEASINFTNVTGGGTQFVSPDSDTGPEVTHLSKVLFDTQASPVLYVSPGDSIPFANAVLNTGNGTDTYSIRQVEPLVSAWDTGIFLDQNANGQLEGGEPEITSSAEITDLASRDTSHLILVVTVPSGSSLARRDTFVISARSKRTEDPIPGQDTAFMTVQTDTSSVDVFNPDPPFDFVDTQAITNDTSVKLRFPALAEVDEQNVTYFDTNGQVSQTGFHSHVTGDSDWTLTDAEGPHTFKVQYKFNNGQFSDTYTDVITLDHSAPSDSQLQINNGDSATVSLNVSLDPFLASDTNWSAGSGQGRVVIDNDSTFSTADVDTRIMPDTGDRSGDSWTVSTAGQVFAKYIDAAGNVSGFISDTITIDLNTTQLDQLTYEGLLAEARVTINDFGANSDPTAIDDTTVLVTSELDPDGITVRVVETSPNSGQFEGTFGFTEGFSDDSEDKIFIEPNAQFSVTFVSSAGQTSQDTATWTRDPSSATTVDDVRTWPNPFHPLDGTPFVFQNLPADEGLEIRIFNVSGQLVRRLTVGRGIEFNPNGNIARWFGRNDVGDMVASGVYIYVVNSKFGQKRGKLTLVK